MEHVKKTFGSRKNQLSIFSVKINFETEVRKKENIFLRSVLGDLSRS